MNIPSFVVWALFVRIFCCYIVIILIALQSVSAIAAVNASHQESHQFTHKNAHLKTTNHSHLNNHQDSDHHSEQELLAFQAQALDGENTHSDADHPDCHSNHCHHSNLVYLDLSSSVALLNTTEKQVINTTTAFNSLPISPDLRPPIV
ncbi:MAG: hypothetical protein GY787_06570 [Alteromonadales bacterium]|nr:hypothetical protein [Alteromonadales bacterium]